MQTHQVVKKADGDKKARTQILANNREAKEKKNKNNKKQKQTQERIDVAMQKQSTMEPMEATHYLSLIHTSEPRD